MKFEEYIALYEQILKQEKPVEPYNDPEYLNYTKLNLSRTKRWMKTGKLSPDVKAAITTITHPQTWIVITEPWCGDAAHIVPFIEMMAKENPLITTIYELRDAEPFRINDYLSNGSKAIPKMIIKDADGNDLATWGPRPTECQALFQKLKEEDADFSVIKEALQHWYNNDKGLSIQKEISQLVQKEISILSV